VPPESLLQKYLASLYCFRDAGREFVLHVGVRSRELAALQRARGVRSSAYLTAWNPASEALSKEENGSRNASLRREVESLGLEVLDGEGRSPKRDWCEESFLILGLERDRALALARKCGQVAFLHAGIDGVPELVICEEEGA
jgi:hypothetical protein